MRVTQLINNCDDSLISRIIKDYPESLSDRDINELTNYFVREHYALDLELLKAKTNKHVRVTEAYYRKLTAFYASRGMSEHLKSLINAIGKPLPDIPERIFKRGISRLINKYLRNPERVNQLVDYIDLFDQPFSLPNEALRIIDSIK